MIRFSMYYKDLQDRLPVFIFKMAAKMAAKVVVNDEGSNTVTIHKSTLPWNKHIFYK